MANKNLEDALRALVEKFDVKPMESSKVMHPGLERNEYLKQMPVGEPEFDEYEYNPSRTLKEIKKIPPPPFGSEEGSENIPSTLDTDYYDENLVSAEPSASPMSDDELWYKMNQDINKQREMQKDLEKNRFKKLKQKLKPIV